MVKGNYVLADVAQEANTTGRHVALFPVREDWHKAREDAMLESSSAEDIHGGELEVSQLRHGAPRLMGDGVAGDDHSGPERPHLLTLGMAGYTANGIVGRPSLGTAEKDKAILESLSRSAAAHLAIITKG
ncbi:creatininase family protein [Kitasatospora purpeofusca]|uniref:creatininase family protein n=1 Tax=Kitasatospora purpeofusca TaxID=67352 RepID=UPI002E142438|nr:creatininase family protein [Kitasatospora purpeofusca]